MLIRKAKEGRRTFKVLLSWQLSWIILICKALYNNIKHDQEGVPHAVLSPRWSVKQLLTCLYKGGETLNIFCLYFKSTLEFQFKEWSREVAQTALSPWWSVRQLLTCLYKGNEHIVVLLNLLLSFEAKYMILINRY